MTDGDAKRELLVAEYQLAAGLVRSYREMELKALGAAGLVLSAVLAAFRGAAGIRRGERARLVYALAALITAFVLLVVLMATMRGVRAVAYIREWLHPLAAHLTDDPRFLAWEAVNDTIYLGPAGVWGRVLRYALSAAVVVVLVGLTSFGLAVAAWTVHDAGAPARVIASGAAVCDLAFIEALGLQSSAAAAFPEPRLHISRVRSRSPRKPGRLTLVGARRGAHVQSALIDVCSTTLRGRVCAASFVAHSRSGGDAG